MSARLFHYTCDDGLRGILSDGSSPGLGVLRLNYHPILGVPLIWLTDLEEPLREPLGLTSYSLNCDRTAHRFEVIDTRGCQPWTKYARTLPRVLRQQLEGAPGAMPRHWWVSFGPLPVVLRERAVAR